MEGMQLIIKIYAVIAMCLSFLLLVSFGGPLVLISSEGSQSGVNPVAAVAIFATILCSFILGFLILRSKSFGQQLAYLIISAPLTSFVLLLLL